MVPQRNVIVNSRKAFSLLEFLVSVIILTLTLVALFNAVVFFLNLKIRNTVSSRAVDASQELLANPQKLENCIGKDSCEELLSSCTSSVYCSSPDVCTNLNSCIVCYTNPENGKKIYYGLSSFQLSNGTYKVELCWIFGNSNGTYTTVITLPSNF